MQIERMEGGIPISDIESILSALPLPLVIVGADERIRALNAKAETLFGTGLVGRHYFAVLRQPDILEAISIALRSGRSGVTRFHGRDHAQNTIYQVRASVMELDGQRMVLASFEDITSQETVGQMRRDFVANVSHELRTPLTALVGFIDTLRGSARDDPAARERFLQTMEDEAGRMNRLIDDLLSLSRVEDEERVRPTERVDLLATVKSVCRSLAPLAQGAGVTLELKPTGDGHFISLGDPDQLLQVFANLIENAIKYGGDGDRIELVLQRLDRDPVLRAPAIQVDVTDFGGGIDDIHIHRLTERFYRVDGHRARALGGTGLGLAIVKHIVNRHRGRLRIRSALGDGSTFSVIVPATLG